MVSTTQLQALHACAYICAFQMPHQEVCGTVVWMVLILLSHGSAFISLSTGVSQFSKRHSGYSCPSGVFDVLSVQPHGVSVVCCYRLIVHIHHLAAFLTAMASSCCLATAFASSPVALLLCCLP